MPCAKLYLRSVASNRLPANLTDASKLPDVYATAREGFGFEWYELDASGSRSVVVYRFTLGGKCSWSQCLVVSAGDTFAHIVRRAKALAVAP